MPNELCPICVSRLTYAADNPAELPRVVAEWLIDYDESGGLAAGQSYEALAVDLLQLVSETAERLKRQPGEPPF